MTQRKTMPEIIREMALEDNPLIAESDMLQPKFLEIYKKKQKLNYMDAMFTLAVHMKEGDLADAAHSMKIIDITYEKGKITNGKRMLMAEISKAIMEKAEKRFINHKELRI